MSDIDIDDDLLADEHLADDGNHDATEVPLRLSADDALLQRDVEAAVYDHATQLTRAEHIAMFNDAPISNTPFATLRRLCERKDVKGALQLLSGRHRLEIDPDLVVDTSEPHIIPSVGPHFLDLVMYVGARRGLDATLPYDRIDHTWSCRLNFSGIHRLWPDSKATRLPFDHHGRMMSIGTRKEEQIWIAMVPNEWLVPDHPFNASGVWPRLPDPTSAMSHKHALMLVMFFAHTFHAMQLRDFVCREQYPQTLTRRAVNDATDILHGEASRDFNLRIMDLEIVHRRFLDAWIDWVRQACPPTTCFTPSSHPAIILNWSQGQSDLVTEYTLPYWWIRIRTDCTSCGTRLRG
ncbi:hypothetical protein JVT61DRAFT_12447 [Boletus reticuloceps]|uniref:DUF8190 domain-containing protein n=1 Tax=Boletus reticuloceps TaxID=495285 RepID=A0A8I3A3J6_9AGAM|nr:hypothetical protein JVT61DRAFT_12447 [Boletus reticuloceps]